tara:strand:- start:1886 stop:2236 length:351 start_codon:yes stop_codon:yes gene_type:complete
MLFIKSIAPKHYPYDNDKLLLIIHCYKLFKNSLIAIFPMFRKDDKDRNLKKIFQWEDYLNWRKMSRQQKINLKRACLFPFLAFFVYKFLSEFTYAILLLVCIYLLIRFKNRRRITK